MQTHKYFKTNNDYMNKRLCLIIHGSVQMVGFRFSTRRKASSLELTGFIRNLPDGTVEVVVEGEKERLEELLQFCRKGPVFARVDKIDIRWEEYKNEFARFTIEYF